MLLCVYIQLQHIHLVQFPSPLLSLDSLLIFSSLSLPSSLFPPSFSPTFPLLFSLPLSFFLSLPLLLSLFLPSGRSGNVWISPKGSMMFSTALKVTPTSHLYRRMPLLQHIVALSVVSAIRTIPGYEVYRLYVVIVQVLCVYGTRTCDIPYILSCI